MIEKTSDILDAASQRSQQELDSILAAHKARKDTSMQPKGSCHFCDEPTDLLFCDEYCRDDYQYIEKRKQINIR